MIGHYCPLRFGFRGGGGIRFDAGEQNGTDLDVHGADEVIIEADTILQLMSNNANPNLGVQLSGGLAGTGRIGASTSTGGINIEATNSDVRIRAAGGGKRIRLVGTIVNGDAGDILFLSEDMIDAKGDLLAGIAADDISRLAVGANGTVLTADSVEATGLKWAAAAAGGTIFRKVTEKDVVNTVAETDLLNDEITIPGGTLGATGILRAVLVGDYRNFSGANSALTVALRLGATNLAKDTTTANPSVDERVPFVIEIWIFALNATNSQFAAFKMIMSSTGLLPSNGIGGIPHIGNAGQTHVGAMATSGASAIDFTADQTFKFRVGHDAANANLSMRLKAARIEVVA